MIRMIANLKMAAVLLCGVTGGPGLLWAHGRYTARPRPELCDAKRITAAHIIVKAPTQGLQNARQNEASEMPNRLTVQLRMERARN